MPTAINDAGDIVGYCGAGEATTFAVLWKNGTVTDLGRHDGGTFSRGSAISSLGQIVGAGDTGDIDTKALIHDGARWIAIDTSGGSDQEANGITDDGLIFGNFTHFLPLVALLILWTAVYRGRADLAGYSYPAMLTYFVLARAIQTEDRQLCP